MVPMYVRYMGAEAYGLVGFFAMLQAWFQLLDMGLTPTMARETARFQGGASDVLRLRRLLRALEGIFIGVAILGATAMIAGAGSIAGKWLKVQQLSLIEVQHAIMLMALIVALRWVGGLYRGAITGFECLVWLSGFNIAVATIRFVLVFLIFFYVGTSPTDFFIFQLIVAVIEVVLLVRQTYRLLPRVPVGQRIPWQWEPLRGVLRFSLSMAFSGSLWVLVTQTDKLILSKLLLLTDYAYFTLAALVASGLMIISTPISGALLPRLTRLNAEGDEAGLFRLYCNATQLVAVITIPASLVLAFFAEQVLWAWTGDAEIAHKASPVLIYYSLGNGILAMGAFPFYLQYAKGDLKLHLIGSILFMGLLMPSLFFASWKYGIKGPGYAWFWTQVVLFLFWLPKIHRRFGKGLHTRWLLPDVGVILFLSVSGAALAHKFIKWPQQRLSVAFGIVMVSLVLLAIAATGSSWVREAICIRLRARFILRLRRYVTELLRSRQ